METLKLTAEHFQQSNSYWKDYIGTVDVSDYQGSIEIEGNLGYIQFDCIKTENLFLEVGSSLEVGGSLEVGSSLKVGSSLEVGRSLKVGGYLEVGGSLKVGGYLEVGGSLKVGGYLEVKHGISVALCISVKGKMTWSLRCFAGICQWRNIDESEKTITCGKKEGTGVVEYGILVETGIPDEKPIETVEELTLEQVCERLGKNIKIIK